MFSGSISHRANSKLCLLQSATQSNAPSPHKGPKHQETLSLHYRPLFGSYLKLACYSHEVLRNGVPCLRIARKASVLALAPKTTKLALSRCQSPLISMRIPYVLFLYFLVDHNQGLGFCQPNHAPVNPEGKLLRGLSSYEHFAPARQRMLLERGIIWDIVGDLKEIHRCNLHLCRFLCSYFPEGHQGL